MMIKNYFSTLLLCTGITFFSNAQAPENKVKTTVQPFDGTMVLGYVDNGGYLNFTGPNISFTKGKSKLMLGMLPSLRYKEDHSAIKNAPVTPGLGFGLTFCYKKFAFQVPLHYNAKTATANGEWNIGAGIGFRLK